jgi:hypothetical protein
MKNIIGTFSIVLFLSFTVVIHGFAQAEKSEEASSEKISKLLVIVLVQNVENRRTLEDELRYTFGDYDVEAVSSYNTILAGSERLSKANVLKVCEQKGTDGVLVVRLVDSKQENSYSYNQRSQYTGAGFSSNNSSGVVYSNGSSHSWGDYAYGNYFDTVSSTKILVQSDVYLVEGAKLLYVKDTKMRVGEVEEAIGKFAKKLSKKISKQKFMVGN